MTIDVFKILRAIMYKPPGQDRIGWGEENKDNGCYK